MFRRCTQWAHVLNVSERGVQDLADRLSPARGAPPLARLQPSIVRDAVIGCKILAGFTPRVICRPSCNLWDQHLKIYQGRSPDLHDGLTKPRSVSRNKTSNLSR